MPCERTSDPSGTPFFTSLLAHVPLSELSEDPRGRRERFVVAPGGARRLDSLLAEELDGVSRAQAKRLIEDGSVLVDGVTARPSRVLRGGETVEAAIPPPVTATPRPEPIPLKIVHEDTSLVVVDKPAGMVVHPGAGHGEGTLVNALLAHVRDLSGVGGVLRPGIVHRLDRGTSGLIVVAKHDRAHHHLAAQFAEREVEKTYLALVHGHPPDRLEIDKPIGRDPKHRKKISSRSAHPRTARTLARCLERFPGSALLSVRIETGRTHQIRVHLSEAGYPLVGDRDYGAPKRGAAPAPLTRFGRPALHAAELGFRHPETDEWMRFESPLPEDLAALLEALRRCAS